MSKAVVTAFLEAISVGDRDAALALAADDVIFDMPDGRRVIGRDDLRLALAQRASHFHETLADIAVMTGDGRAAAEFTLKGAYIAAEPGLPNASGQRFSLQAGAFFEFDDGRISRFSLAINDAALRRQLAE